MDNEHTSRKLSLFLCHAEEDHDAVVLLREQLRAMGFDPWLKDLYPGMDWDMVIMKTLRETDSIIICLSDIAVHKTGYIHHEIDTAIKLASYHPEGDIFIIPIKLSKCEYPYKLEKWQYAKLYESDGFENLTMSLNLRANQVGITPINYNNLGDLTNEMLIELVLNSSNSSNLFKEICKRTDSGEIPVELLTKFNNHPYWLIRKTAIEHIIKSNSSKTLAYLYSYRNVKYFLSQQLIRNYIINRISDNSLSKSEARIAADLIQSLTNVSGISDATIKKNLRVHSEILDKYDITQYVDIHKRRLAYHMLHAVLKEVLCFNVRY